MCDKQPRCSPCCFMRGEKAAIVINGRASPSPPTKPRHRLVLAILASPFKLKCRLELENTMLRHQVMVARGRIRLTNLDRLFLVQLYRWFPLMLQVLAVVQPETVIRWHRAGFRSYWRWKSRWRGGRPAIGSDLRLL